MKSFRFLISSTALILGMGVVMVSLTSASRVYSSDGMNASRMQLYLSDTILPDNVLYPAYMVNDKLKLELATPEEKIYLMLEYADRRLFFSKELMEKERADLALTTLTKSQKYLNAAAQMSLEQNASSEQKKRVITAISDQSQEVKSIFDSFDPADKAVLERLSSEALIWQEKLIESL